ncbi:MAG: OmpA family protein [Pseudomonadota bacterium]
MALVWPLSAVALTLDLPMGARLVADQTQPGSDYVLATGPYSDGALAQRVVSGTLRQEVWQLPITGLTTQQILAPLATQLDLQGYDILYSCADRTCGGFDFRFEIDVISAPAMFVDLGDFRYLSAVRGEDALSLLISRASGLGFIQLGTISPNETAERSVTTEGGQNAQITRNSQSTPGTLAAQLDTAGHAILWDLAFAPGSSRLGDGPFASLVQLSEYLKRQPRLSVAVVGHTDSVGALTTNIALSKRRARSVRDRLINRYGIPPAQMEAEGMGYLAPIADNRVDLGREANRRVEIVITATE